MQRYVVSSRGARACNARWKKSRKSRWARKKRGKGGMEPGKVQQGSEQAADCDSSRRRVCAVMMLGKQEEEAEQVQQ